MLRTVCTMLIGLLLLSATLSSAAEPKGDAAVKQAELAKRLVDLFGWSEGLPENPQEKDYKVILGGQRRFRFEAEETYDRAFDAVAVRDYNLFGPFTGRGWLHGITVPTAVHFKVFIPIAGKYTLSAVTKGDDQLWSVAGRAFKVNAGEKLKTTVIGQAFIPAGILEFNAVVPPGGAIDAIEFSAPALAPLEPLSGWNFSANLTGGQLAEVAAPLLGTEALLPEDQSAPHKMLSAAAVTPLPEALLLTDSQVLGKTIADKWVRAGQVAGQLTMPVEIDATGVYQVRVRFVGSTLTAGFGDRTVTMPGKPYLDWVECGVFRLAKGKNMLSLRIPPSGGVDSVEIIRRKSSTADYVAVMKLGKGGDETVSSAELDNLLKSLQEKFRERQ